MSVKKTDVFPSAFRVAPLLYYLFSRAARFPCVLPCILPRKADMEISFITFSLSPQGGCTGQITAVNRTVEYRNADRPFWVVHSVRICRKSRFTAVKLFVPTLKLYDSLALYAEADKILQEIYYPGAEKIFAALKRGDGNDARFTMQEITDDVDIVYSNFDKMVDNRMADVKDTSDENGVISSTLLIILAILVVLGITIGIFLARRISQMIGTPINRVVEAAGQIALGRVDVNLTDVDAKDETGQLADAFTNMLEGIRKQIRAAELISNGDFTQSVPLRSNEDALGLALQKIEQDLSRTLSVISTAAEQVDTGAEQVSSAAQALASGSTEQAATVEELNASIIGVTQQSEQNLDSVRKATEYVHQAGNGVGRSNEYMNRLNTAMKEIGETSQEISKITKLVEDIAFQTNILALNAAVEAARAGNAGKGFAVVADEVRNLAAKSAEAAKQTAELIQKAVTSVSEGEQLAVETLKQLGDVSEKAQLVERAVKEVESATSEQAIAIAQINDGLSQVSAVVQTNAATAEESSASSEELAAQAQTLQGEVTKFKLGKQQYYPEFDLQRSHSEERSEKETELSLTIDTFGKY